MNLSVTDVPVVNASPLIYLARAGMFDLLLEAGPKLVVPDSVVNELEARGPTDPAVLAIASAAWLERVRDPQISAAILAWDLGPGESSVVAWAQAHAGTTAIIDDLAGRRCAESLSIPVRGTLGLVLLAKKRGKIPSARQAVDKLRAHGMYLADATIDRAVKLVGE